MLFRSHFLVDTKPVHIAVADAARAMNSHVLRLVAPVFAMFRCQTLSLTFALLSLATGWRGIYPIRVASGLSVILATLVFYVTPIEDAMRGRFAAPPAA